jgi:hypothetical protein
MMQAYGTLTRSVLAVLAVAAFSAPALAGHLDYTLRGGIAHSDNVNLSATNPISQNILVPGLDFAYTQQGASIQADFSGSLEYRDYLGNAFDNQTLAALSGNMNWSMVPQFLDFQVQDVAAVEPLSTLSVNTPNNQQQTNVLTVGPTFHFGHTGTVHAQADLRYINSHASRTRSFNSSRGLAALRLIKDISPVSNISLNAQSQHVEFDNDFRQSDYNGTSVYAQYTSNLKDLRLDLVLGRSWVNFKTVPTVASPMARLSLGWQATPHNGFNLSASRQYSDAATDLRSGQRLGQGPNNAPDVALGTNNRGINTGSAVINSEVYLVRRFNATYAYTNTTFDLTLSPYYDKLDYPNNPSFNQINRGGSIGMDYRLNPRLTFSGYANTERRNYRALQRRDRITNYGLALTRQWTEHWSWRLSFDQRRQRSTAVGESYHANEIYLGFAYKR